MATVMVLVNWDHHYDLDKEVPVLTIPKDYLLLLVFAALVVSSTLGLILAVANQIHTLWSFNFILLLYLPHIKTLSIDRIEYEREPSFQDNIENMINAKINIYTN